MGGYAASPARWSLGGGTTPCFPLACSVEQSPAANLTYVHVGRVVALARRRGVIPGTLLGNVIAHELGHILLPSAGHSGTGIMTEMLNLLTTSAVGFTPEQVVAIRATLEHQSDAVVARLE